jgi:hypothetical protein
MLVRLAKVQQVPVPVVDHLADLDYMVLLHVVGLQINGQVLVRLFPILLVHKRINHKIAYIHVQTRLK